MQCTLVEEKKVKVDYKYSFPACKCQQTGKSWYTGVRMHEWRALMFSSKTLANFLEQSAHVITPRVLFGINTRRIVISARPPKGGPSIFNQV